MTLFRHADPRFPFLWEHQDQPPGRWHGGTEGPVHYLADTPDGAWAEFLRHEGIQTEAEAANVRRALWAIEVRDPLRAATPRLPRETLAGGINTYEDCRAEARRLRDAGETALRAPSAALAPGDARGWRVDGGLQPGPTRDGVVFVLFGPRPDLIGWAATEAGRPPSDLLPRVRHL